MACLASVAHTQLVKTPEWKQDPQRMAEDFMNSAQTLRHLESETESLQKLLAELGMISRWREGAINDV